MSTVGVLYAEYEADMIGHLESQEAQEEMKDTEYVETTIETDTDVVVVRLVNGVKNKLKRPQGRPKGSKNKKYVAPKVGDGIAVRCKGQTFSKEEELKLA